MTGLCSTKASKSKVESRMSDCSISFKYNKTLITEIRDIISKTQDGTFDVIGKLKLVEEQGKVLCRTPKKER